VVTSLPDFITMLVRVLLMGVCSALMLRGRLTVGQVAVLVVVIGQSFTPVSSLSGVSGSLIQTFAAAERFFGLMDETPQVADAPGVEDLTAGEPDVDYDKVAFSYPGTETPVLRGVSMDLPKGSHVALWGESGCGKSTLLRLLLRFWDPDGGEVRMDGETLPRLKLAEVRERVSMLAQDTWLSGDSVAENIRLARKDASREEIEEAARRACIYDTVQSLPQGFDTPAGELGDRLSGGERQRIGIARVLLRKSPIMVFDEPTSSLDTLNEKGILKTLHEECADATVITVSHRQSTIAGADHVFHIVDGLIDEKAEFAK
jgi:ATP-binding cassette subfamily C protein